jgi:hypothetical protein
MNERGICAFWPGYRSLDGAMTAARARCRIYGPTTEIGKLHIFKRDGRWHVGRLRR